MEPAENPQIKIDKSLYDRLKYLGIIRDHIGEDVRSFNIGNSNYSEYLIQPWTIWLEYQLNAWDADIIKRVLRNKKGETRISDYEKIVHICKERIRQLENEYIQSNRRRNFL